MEKGVIGGGNMANAIMVGIVNIHLVPASEIIGSDLSTDSLNKVKDELGIHVTTDNKEVVKSSEVIFLSVKPQFYKSVIAEIKADNTKLT